ncbi:hypothetical protein [Haloglomus irregulare]|nr:hypothetical protein [Haloglomus irregulare]
MDTAAITADYNEADGVLEIRLLVLGEVPRATTPSRTARVSDGLSGP